MVSTSGSWTQISLWCGPSGPQPHLPLLLYLPSVLQDPKCLLSDTFMSGNSNSGRS